MKQQPVKKEASIPPLAPPPTPHIPIGEKGQAIAVAAAKAGIEVEGVILPPEPPQTLYIPIDEKQQAAAATTKASIEVEQVVLNKVESDLQVYFDMPYDIEFSPTPFDNYTSQHMATWGDHPTLEMTIKMCSDTGLPQMTDDQKLTPAAWIKKWKYQLRELTSLQ